MEKDWIVAVCGGSCARLSVTNTNVRTIDLAANLTAPLLAGQLLYFCPYYIAALVLIVWVTQQLWSHFECFFLQPLPPQLRQLIDTSYDLLLAGASLHDGGAAAAELHVPAEPVSAEEGVLRQVTRSQTMSDSTSAAN